MFWLTAHCMLRRLQYLTAVICTGKLLSENVSTSVCMWTSVIVRKTVCCFQLHYPFPKEEKKHAEDSTSLPKILHRHTVGQLSHRNINEKYTPTNTKTAAM